MILSPFKYLFRKNPKKEKNPKNIIKIYYYIFYR